jgi:hypothetical protein
LELKPVAQSHPHPSAHARSAAPSAPSSSAAATATTTDTSELDNDDDDDELHNDDDCHLCGETSGRLVCCSFCNRSFHVRCLGREKEPSLDAWACPRKLCKVSLLTRGEPPRSL